ncbi:MAG TPA: DsbA family protein [Myxococcota bacterium]|jgi:predicted DsbA family dithiol-disulfide isomerase|nr:DsbA family protein [Myxococcota bacterium]
MEGGATGRVRGATERSAGSGALVVPVLYDFASTIAYVAHRVLGALEPELAAAGVALSWRPIDLAQLLRIERDATIAAERRENALRVARELGVAVRAPTRWLDSRRAHAAILLLQGSAREPSFRERVWSAVFEEAADPGEPGAVERWAAELGIALDPARLARAEEDLALRTHVAEEQGVSGVPTLLLDAWPLGGIQTPETMRLLLERWSRRKRGASG